jgi:hypothetical protein
MKPESNTSPEYQRFEDLLRKIVSIPSSEAKRIIESEKKAKTKRKKRVKKPASRASNDREY